jgi:hypothetical protein
VSVAADVRELVMGKVPRQWLGATSSPRSSTAVPPTCCLLCFLPATMYLVVCHRRAVAGDGQGHASAVLPVINHPPCKQIWLCIADVRELVMDKVRRHPQPEFLNHTANNPLSAVMLSDHQPYILCVVCRRRALASNRRPGICCATNQLTNLANIFMLQTCVSW